MYGKDQVKSWRRAYDDPPPPMEDNHEFHPARDPRYRHVRQHLVVVHAAAVSYHVLDAFRLTLFFSFYCNRCWS